jgi:hypothetical protein
VLLVFLFDFGLPWLEFRQATRRNDSESMTSMYGLVLDWFRATGKKLYARICLDYMWIYMSLNQALQAVWDEHRTCSLIGNDGRNIGWDQANEFMNLFVKGKKPTSPRRIDKLILMLNALRGCEDHLRAALGRERAGPEESTAVKATDVGAIVDALRETMGDDIFGDNRRHKNSSPFGHGRDPRKRVRNPSGMANNATDDALRQEKSRWILERLEENPFPADASL